MLDGAAQDGDQLVVAERLLYVVEGPFVHGLHGGLQRRLSGHEDDWRVGIARAHGRQDLHPTNSRHAHVGEDDVRIDLAQAIERFLPT